MRLVVLSDFADGVKHMALKFLFIRRARLVNASAQSAQKSPKLMKLPERERGNDVLTKRRP